MTPGVTLTNVGSLFDCGGRWSCGNGGSAGAPVIKCHDIGLESCEPSGYSIQNILWGQAASGKSKRKGAM